MRLDPNAFYSVIMTIVVATMSRLLGYTPTQFLLANDFYWFPYAVIDNIHDFLLLQ